MLKDIKGYEGLYAISDDGRVWSYRSKKYIKAHDNNLGYLKVCLYDNGNRQNARIHRLVLETFNPVDGMENLQVNHIDEDKHNNCLSNLEWVTASENTQHSIHKRKGVKRGKIKPVEQYTSNGVFIAVYKNQCEAARQTGVSRYSISDALRGRTAVAGGYIWRFRDEEREIQKDIGNEDQ